MTNNFLCLFFIKNVSVMYLLCYEPLESALGPKVHGAPNLLIGDSVPPAFLLRRDGRGPPAALMHSLV